MTTDRISFNDKQLDKAMASTRYEESHYADEDRISYTPIVLQTLVPCQKGRSHSFPIAIGSQEVTRGAHNA